MVHEGPAAARRRAQLQPVEAAVGSGEGDGGDNATERRLCSGRAHGHERLFVAARVSRSERVVAGGDGEAPAHCRVGPASGDDRSQRLSQLAGTSQVEVGWSGDGRADGGGPRDEPGGSVERVGAVGMVAGVQERRQDPEVFRAHVTSVIDTPVLSDTSKSFTLVSHEAVERAVDVSLGWMFLVAAIVGDTIGTIALERSDGMRRALPAAVSVTAYLAAVVSFGAAIERVPISVADAVYAAGSTSLITAVAIGLGRERLDMRKGLGLALVVVGVAVLRLDGAA